MTWVLADIPEGSDAVWLCLSLSIVRPTELALFGLYHFCFSVLTCFLIQVVLALQCFGFTWVHVLAVHTGCMWRGHDVHWDLNT